MSNKEIPAGKASEVMALADRRVNVNQEDIPREQKLAIVKLETDLSGFMRDPKYKEMRDIYIKRYDVTGRGVEELFATMKLHYSEVQSGESEHAGEQLRAITDIALHEMEDLKMRMGFASEDHESETRSYSSTVAKATGADRPLAAAPELAENMDMVEAMLGVTPREKIEVNVERNKDRLVELRRPENAGAYLAAKASYSHITGGLYLEDATKLLSDAFSAGLRKVTKEPDETKKRRTLTDLVATQLKALEGLYHILTQDVRAKAPQLEPKEEIDHAEETFSDGDMADILQTVFASARWDKVDANKPFEMPKTLSEQMEAYYQVGPAYTYYTGRGSDDIGITEAAALGTAQGALSALVTVDQMAIGAAGWVGKKVGLVEAPRPSPETHEAEHWTVKVLEAGKSALDPHTWAMAWQMLTYGLENTTATEKIFMVNKIVTEFYVAGLIGGEVLHALKIGKVGLQGSRAMKMMVGTMEVVATSCPALAKYGYTTERIAVGLQNAAAKATHVWDHTLHLAHKAETAHNVEAKIYHPTAGATIHAAEEVLHAKHTFEYDEMDKIGQDIRLALKSADSLGFTDEQVDALRSSNYELSKRKSAVDVRPRG